MSDTEILYLLSTNKMPKQSSNTIVFALICIALFIGLMYWVDRMFMNNYITECFVSGITHTVDLPLTTLTSCQNMCGPPGRCSITGTQCLSDIDCYGCQPNTSPDLSNTFLNKNAKIYGDSQSGKLSYLAPDYSPLIHDIGTRSKPLGGSPHTKPPVYNKGVDTWTKRASAMRQIHDFTYKPPPNTLFLPAYPTRYGVTGGSNNDGPFASNATLVPL